MSYQPISCTFHDYIEHFIVRREIVVVKFIDNDEEKVIKTKILDSYTSPSKEEFMVLEDYSSHIRLDKIISINQYVLSEYELGVNL